MAIFTPFQLPQCVSFFFPLAHLSYKQRVKANGMKSPREQGRAFSLMRLIPALIFSLLFSQSRVARAVFSCWRIEGPGFGQWKRRAVGFSLNSFAAIPKKVLTTKWARRGMHLVGMDAWRVSTVRQTDSTRCGTNRCDAASSRYARSLTFCIIDAWMFPVV